MADDPTGADIIKLFGNAPPQAGGTTAPASAPSGADIVKQFQDQAAAEAAAKAVASPPPMSLRDRIAGATESVIHGLSFGLNRPLDRATAALYDAVVPGFGLGKIQAQREQVQQQYATEHPLEKATGEAIGSLPTFAMGEGALARVIPGAVGAGAGLLDRGLNLLGASARSGVVSAAAGAGLSDSDLSGAGKAAATGAAIGAAAPPAFAAIGKVLTGASAPIMARLWPGAADSQAVGKVAQAAARDAMTPDELAANLKGLGPDAVLVDAGGKNLRQLGASVANVPGPAAQQAEQFLEGRAAGQQGRINTAITAATGSTGDYHAALGQLATQRATNAAPIYKSAFDRIIVTPEEAAKVQRFVADPIGQDALQKGMRVIELEKLAANEPFNPAEYGVTRGDDGKFELGSGTPTLRLMDAVKRGYDEIVEGFRDSTSGRLNLNQYGRAVDSVRRAYVGDLRNMFPRYGSALDAWGGPSQAMDALSMGRRALSNDPEVTAATIGKLSPSDKEFFKTGVARALKDKTDSVQDGSDATRRIFGNTLVRDKIAAAFGDPNAFADFQNTMEREATFARTRNEVLKGSRTTPLAAAQEDMSAADLAQLAALAHVNPLAAGAQVAGRAYNALAGPGGPRVAAIGRGLFTPGAMDNEYLAALRRASDPRLREAATQFLTMEPNRLNALRAPR